MPVSAPATDGAAVHTSFFGRLAARPRRAVAAALVVVAVAGGATYLGHQHQQSGLSADGFPLAAPMAIGTQAVKFAVVGDSITADHAYPDQVGQRIVGERSWAAFAQQPGTSFVGGWARGGATTAQMLAGFTPVPADVLVMIAGTNDIKAGVAFEQIGENMRSIVAVADVPRVIVSSVPPRNELSERTMEYNAWLQEFATAQGWGWIDGSRGLRDPDQPGRYAAGLTYDGTHPTREGAQILGAAVLAALGTQPTAQEATVDLP